MADNDYHQDDDEDVNSEIADKKKIDLNVTLPNVTNIFVLFKSDTFLPAQSRASDANYNKNGISFKFR